jgi:hypothetical protein
MSDNGPEDNSADIIKDESGNSQDSFNKDLEKKYEEHKKSETKVPHRPISSYTANRNFNQANKEMDSEKQIKNKPQSAQASKSSNNNSKNSNNKDQQSKSNSNSNNNKNNNNNNNNDEIGINELLIDLNRFFYLHKIKKTDFIDNPNVFLNFDDFCDVFKQIHYTLPKKYLKMLFDYNNPEGAQENYILMSNFIKILEFYKIEGIGNESELSKFENLGYSQSNSRRSQMGEKTSSDMLERKSNKSIYELKYINEQYNQFNKDIMDILRGSKKNGPSYNNYNYKFNTNISMNKKGVRGKNLSASKISIESRPKNVSKSKYEENKSKEEKKKLYNPDEIEEKMVKEQEKEEKNIAYLLEKRDKTFLKDCVYKCEECNRICHLLGSSKTYSLVFEEEMACRIQEEGKEDKFISLKELIIEWRRLYKQYHRFETQEKYKENEDINKSKNVELLLNERKREKEEKQREIKEVLIEAVRLKTKLKTQLDDLKSNIKIDEKVVLEHLSRAGMEIPDLKEKNNEKAGNSKDKKSNENKNHKK